MQLVDRYLHAIEFWLPRRQSRDIIAEISEDLHSQIEDRERELGRPLGEAELASLIQQRGRPVLVAHHYLPQRFLIGPVLFPVYTFVLKIFGLWCLAPWTVVSITLHRLQHPASPWLETVVAAGRSVWSTAFLGAAAITLLFAILQAVEYKQGWLGEWNPRQLPARRDPRKISRTDSTIEVTVCGAATVWWIAHASSPHILNGPHIQVVLTSQWMTFFWGFLMLTSLQAGFATVNWIRPYWTRSRAFVRLALHAAGGALFCWILRAHLIADLEISNVGRGWAAEIRDDIHRWLERGFPFAVVAVMLALAPDLYRLIRIGREGRRSVPSD